jgi:rod shape determining protein RodA
MNRRENLAAGIDWLTIVIYIVLVFMGWLNIYAAVYSDAHSNIFDFSQRYGAQMLFMVAAFIIAGMILLIDLKVYTFFAYIIYGVTIFLLILVLVPGIGHNINGARSWFKIGKFLIQPAEFAKLATALAIAKYLSAYNIKVNDIKSLFSLGAIIALPMALILLEPDAGSVLVYLSFSIVLFREGLPGGVLLFGFSLGALFFMSLLMPNINIVIIVISLGFLSFAVYTRQFKETGIGFLIFSAIALLTWAVLSILHKTINPYYILSGSFVVAGLGFMVVSFFRRIRFCVAFVTFLIGSIFFTYTVDYFFNHVLEDHQRTRMNILLGKETDPLGMGYNVNQSMIAIGSGGFFGKGYLQGTQTKYNFVPEQSTDFIFCTVGEEWGFLGTSVVLGLFLFLLFRIILLAERQRSVFSRVYAYCVASILFFHVCINAGMTIGLLPVIGIPLPFFSYGGSSLWSFTILLFILIRLDAGRLELLK